MSEFGKKAVSFATKQCVSLVVGAAAGPLGLAVLSEKQNLHAPPKDVESESTDVPSKDEEKIQNRFNHGPNSA